MTPLVENARTELAALRQEMREDPRVQKIEALEKLIALYVADGAIIKECDQAHPEPAPEPRASAPHMIAYGRGTGKVKRKVAPERLQVLEHAANAIRGRSEPTKTAEIYELIGEARELISGHDKRGNLSAMLHHAPMFISHARSGWTLAPETPTFHPSVTHDDEIKEMLS